MKLLVFGDTHGEQDFSYLLGLAREADVIVCVGDVTWFSSDLHSIARGLGLLARDANRPLIVTHGNHEDAEFVQALRVHAPDVVYLHKEVHEYDGALFFGYGGGGFSQKDPHVEKFFHDAYSTTPEFSGAHIWVFHGPPFDVDIDVVPEIGPTGCRSKRALLDTYSPHLVLAGHIHQQMGRVSEIGSTTVVNPGPDGVLVELDYSKTNSTFASSSGASKK